MTKNLTPRMCTALLVAALHLALLYVMLQARGARPVDAPADTGVPIQWLKAIAPHARPALPAPQPTAPRTLQARSKPRSKPTTAPTLRPDPPAPAPAAITPPPVAAEVAPAPAPPPTPTPSIDDIMRIAKRDIGKIDKELQKAYPQRGAVAPLDTPQARLQRGFDAAHAAVLPKWYEASRIEEITQGVANGKRTYKLSTALGVFCYTISDHDGRKMIHNCPN